MINQIPWLTHDKYDTAIAQSAESGKPILIYFHSSGCTGCRTLAENTLSDKAVIEPILNQTIPVWVEVESDKPDPRISELVGSHIFIMSPTLQLISSTGDIYHKFLGSPLHTRLDLGYTRVHHDIEGELPVNEFLAQLDVAMGKWNLFNNQYATSSQFFNKVLRESKRETLSHKEADYWNDVAKEAGTYPEDQQHLTFASAAPLAAEVMKFCQILQTIPDSELMIDWKGEPIKGWEHYTDCLREFVFGVYQALVDFSIETKIALRKDARELTKAQEILREWQISYRELQGTLVGLKGRDLDRQHLGVNFSLGKQRTIRNNVVHCVMAEFWAHGSSVRQALAGIRNGISEKTATTKQPVVETWEKYGPPPFNFGMMAQLLDVSESKHKVLIEEFVDVTDEELEKGYGWWEGTPVTIRFRLNRMGWHLQDHAAVIETIAERIGRVRSETERLAARLYSALGRIEGELVGLPEAEQLTITKDIVEIVKERRLTLKEIYT